MRRFIFYFLWVAGLIVIPLVVMGITPSVPDDVVIDGIPGWLIGLLGAIAFSIYMVHYRQKLKLDREQVNQMIYIRQMISNHESYHAKTTKRLNRHNDRLNRHHNWIARHNIIHSQCPACPDIDNPLYLKTDDNDD